MISLPNPYTKMDLTQDQYDKLLANYIEQIVDGMDLDSLIQFASEQLELNLRESCSTPDELIEEIGRFYDEEVLNDLIESVVESKGGRAKCPYSMMTYTSPLTSKVYQIVETSHTRNAWDEQGNLTPYVQSVFDIYHEGQKVQFALTAEGVADSIAHLENPGPDVSSRFD